MFGYDIKAGIEGAVHSIRQLYDEKADSGFGLFLSDADNAFNSISRSVALWNARVLWVRCSRFLFNSSRVRNINHQRNTGGIFE